MILRSASRHLVIGSLFALGVLIGLAVWNMINLPYGNPDHALGALAIQRFNPNNNTLRFVVFLLAVIMVPVIAAMVAKRHRQRIFGQTDTVARLESSSVFTSSRPLYCVMIFAALFVVSHYVFFTAPGTGPVAPMLDHYHDGQALAPAVSYEKGFIPYKDFYFFHGVYQDPVRVLLAFDLFGRSVGAVHTFMMINLALSFAALGLLVILLFRRNYLASLLLTTFICLFTAINFMTPFRMWERDLLFILFLIALLLIPRLTLSGAAGTGSRAWPVYSLSFLLCFLPPAGFAYALDRGFFLTAALIILWPLLYFIILRGHPLRAGVALASVLGFVAGVLILGLAVKWDFGSFFHYVFVQIPKYKELVDGLEYKTNAHFRAAFYRIYILVLIAASVYWLVYKFLQTVLSGSGSFWQSVETFIRSYFFEISLLLLSVLNFRYGLGHADRYHVATGAIYTVFFLTYVFIRFYVARWVHDARVRRAALAFIILVLPAVMIWDAYLFVNRGVLKRAYPVNVSDNNMLTDEYRQALAFLKPRVNAQSQFASLTNEGSWYYLLDQPCPILFSEVMFAATDYFQQDIIQALETRPVNYVLYHNAAVWNDIDSVSNRQRIPLVFEYVDQHFHFDRQIGSHEIWVRDGFQVPAD